MHHMASTQMAMYDTPLSSVSLLQRTVTAMAKVGIPPEQRDAVFATVAAVLHLGNVSFVEGKESDSSAVAPGAAQEHLQAAGMQSQAKHKRARNCQLRCADRCRLPEA